MLPSGLILKDTYEIENFAASGLAKKVYFARDFKVGRQVILKELSPPVEDQERFREFSEGFEKETQLLASLTHPAIPRIYDYFRTDEGTFQVMEKIQGESLDRIIKRKGKLSLKETLFFAGQLLDLLIYLHRHDPPVIHRNLTPSHLVINENALHCVNFENAACYGDDPDGFFGTPGYAAPEQYPGVNRPVPQSDLYSAAVIIHQSLTGRDPLELGAGEAPSIKALPPDVPPELRDLLEKALDPLPQNRLSSAAHFGSGISLVKNLCEEAVKCSKCSRLNPSGIYFCSYCGHLISPVEKDDKWRPFKIEIGQRLLLHKEEEKAQRAPCIYPLSILASRSPGFDNLLTIDHNRIDEFPHQVRAVKRALKEMGGRCILADEVGLGKTIEAGIIMAELKARNLINSVLIVVPSHLRQQWKEEMNEKFDEEFKIYKGPRSIDWKKDSQVIISMSSAGRRGKTRDKVLDRKWSLIITDEAHHARNSRTLRWSFLDSLRKDFILLLSATPVQNSLLDLFNLVTLLRPGHLHNLKDFRKEYVDPENPRRPKNPEHLKSLLSTVMIRTRRADAMIRFPRRTAVTKYVRLSRREEVLYREVSEFIRKLSLESPQKVPFGLVQLLQRLTSSPAAAATTLLKLSENSRLYSDEQLLKWREFYRLAKDIFEPAKALAAVEIINTVKDRVLLFTDHGDTREFLLEYFAGLDVKAVAYQGSLDEKQAALEKFHNEATVLIASRTGGEGLNLQDVCNVIINYDLPWNPMRLEQRIGRLQRLGQTRDVYVFNMAGENTVEAYILHVLEEKIRMFEMAVGQVDLILGTKFEEDESFTRHIWKKIISSSDEDEIKRKIMEIGDELEDDLKNAEAIRQNASGLDAVST